MSTNKRDKLTLKQEKFCLKFVECGNASKSYRHAFDAQSMKATSINVNASKLLSRTKIALRVKELQEESKARSGITTDQKKQWLKKVIERAISEEGYNGSDVIRAINELNKMDGDHAPAKAAKTDKEGNDIPTHLTVEYIDMK
ncbi:MAG: terminase small subunit [Methylophaga sp.]|nr:terminase small subunit [Methylophaga sp.]